MQFKAQLAHDGSITQQIADFTNVKELYQRLADAFNVNKNEASHSLLIRKLSQHEDANFL